MWLDDRGDVELDVVPASTGIEGTVEAGKDATQRKDAKPNLILVLNRICA